MNWRILNTLFICIYFITSLEIFSQGTWEILESSTQQTLRSVSFVDSLYGWAVGDSGTVMHTSDGGFHWVIQDSKTQNKIVNVFFLNRTLGWASSWNASVVPFGSVILKTTNGGEEWSSIPYRESDLFINCIFFTDSLTGWMGGSPHALVKSIDGGNSWRRAYIDTATFVYLPVLDIEFYDSNYGYACGGTLDNPSVMWKTIDGGDTWYASRQSGVPDQIRDLYIFDSLKIIGVGGDFEITGVGVIRTSDGGEFWDYESVNIAGVATDLDFKNKNEGWASISSLKSFMFTIDAGRTWIQQVAPDSAVINDLVFADSLHGFAVGNDGVILKYIPPVINSVEIFDDEIPQSFYLYQNYPNPFNPITKIKYTIAHPNLPKGEASVGTSFMKFVKLKVYDILGNEIVTLVNGEQPAGSYEVDFNAYNLPSGVYFYQLSIGEKVFTKKMCLLR